MAEELRRVFVVIVNWNRKELVKECLRIVNGVDRKGIELAVVVVDNGSTDGSFEALYGLQFPNFDFRLIKNEENLGYAGGNNVGIELAVKERADYVLIMNNDVVLRKDLTVKLVQEMEKNKDWGMVSPKIYFAHGFEFHKDRYKKTDVGRVIWYAGGRIDWTNMLASHKGVDEVDKGQFSKEEETDFASGACMMVRRDVFGEAGLFDGDYFMYWEDVDLAMRAREKGWKVMYTAETCAWHKVSASSAIGSDLNDYFITRNRLRFGLRYAPLRTKLALLRENLRFLVSGRKWQRRGVMDFILGKMKKGSWK